MPANENEDLSSSPRSWRLFIRSTGREMSDENWQEIERGYIDTLRRSLSIYEKYTIFLPDGDIYVTIDLNGYVEDIEKFTSVMKRIIIDQDTGAASDFNHDGLNIKIDTIASRRSLRSLEETVTIFAIHELFLVLNFADPGVMSLYGSHLTPDPPEFGYRGREYRRDINLHGRIFEVALYENKQSPWLIPQRIDVDIVAKWIRKTCRPDNLVPESSSAKALYALLRISKTEMDAAALIWVFYALESLFQCRSGENFSALNRRISDFLEIRSRDASNLKKRLRKIYDLRSSLVHGGASLAHPMEDDALDKRAFEEIWQFQEAIDFGGSLVIVCLQKLISLGMCRIEFNESINYIEFEK